jgi:hypothetical protein
MKVRIDTTEDPTCAFTGCRGWPTYRHHMGNDGWLGKFNLWIKLRYPQFLDCCKVCDEHHMLIHYNYDLFMKGWKLWTPAGALSLRAALIERCKQHIAGTLPLVNPTKKFKKEWRKSHKEWKKNLPLRD